MLVLWILLLGIARHILAIPITMEDTTDRDFSGIRNNDESISESESVELVKIKIVEDYSSEELVLDDSQKSAEVVRKRQIGGDIATKGLAEDIATLQTIAKILMTVGQEVIPILIDTVSNRQLDTPVALKNVLKKTSSFHLRNILDG